MQGIVKIPAFSLIFHIPIYSATRSVFCAKSTTPWIFRSMWQLKPARKAPSDPRQKTDTEDTSIDFRTSESTGRNWHGGVPTIAGGTAWQPDGIRLDLVVLNAGLMPAQARPSKQGFELMFAVHFLANRVLLERFLDDGVIVPGSGTDGAPRIVFVVSEAHRSAGPIDFEHFGVLVDYGLKDGLKHYGSSKLHSCTLAQELSRRLNPSANEVRVAVHALCPGPVNSNIAREAPAYMKPLLSPVMGLLFARPEKAARPVTHLCCAPELGRRSGVYLHMMREKRPSALARDPAAGARLWEASDALLAEYRPAPRRESPASAP